MKFTLKYESILAICWYVFSAEILCVSAFVPGTKTTERIWSDNASPTTLRNGSTKNSLSQLSAIEGLWKSFEKLTSDRDDTAKNASPGALFFDAINKNDIDEAMTYIIDNEEEEFDYEDTSFPNAWKSPRELERELRLRSEVGDGANLVIEKEIYDPDARKSGIAFSTSEKKGAAFFSLNDQGLIREAFVVTENDKSGESSLKVLKAASDIIGATKDSTGGPQTPQLLSESVSSLTLPEQYFNGWNKRDMKEAVSVFSQDVEYDDTAFPQKFQGKDALEKHLNVCAKAMPSTFSFIVDDKIDAGDNIMLRWHVESNSEELPYTRGCSWYEIEGDKIVKGTDLKEPAVFKTGGIALFFESFLSKLKEEPVRLIPTITWATYIYVVFFSSWFFGLPATALEVRTWEEVRDLSLNFFFVSPILDLPFAPVVHPGLEGIFNLLLSWAAMFAGFLSDDRKRKPNLLPMLPTVIGMQFLTSAFLLPYLATRSREDIDVAIIPRDEITTAIRVAESKILGLAMGFVGTGSIFWAFFARSADFGDIAARFDSLGDLLSIDRVGSSFLVDLAIFAVFQGWLVQDDAKRRGMDPSSISIRLAKYLPFFGLAFYLASRPEILVADEEI